MDPDRHRRDRQGTLGLVQSIGTPVGLERGSGYGTAGLLVEERHPVCEPEETNGLVLLRYKVLGGAPLLRRLLAEMATRVDFDAGSAGRAIRDGHFHLEGVPTVSCCWPGGNSVKICR